MDMNEMVLVSTDDHVIEPADMFEGRLPARFADRAPRIERFEDGSDRWVFQGREVGTSGLQSTASWPHDEWSDDPAPFAEMRPGCYDLGSRVRDMDANGTLASLNFPTFPGFAGQHLAAAPDHDLTKVVVAAYNDWQIDEWAGRHPGRMIPLGILPLWDVEASAAEVGRIAAKGCTAVTFPDATYARGYPSVYTDHWDPLFSACCDHDVAVCLHIGGAFNLLTRPPEAPLEQRIMMSAQMSAVTTVDYIVGGVLTRFPSLKVAMSEGGIGWIPVLLDRMDFTLANQSWSDLDLKGLDATDIFRRNFLACFIQDPSALGLWERIGIDNISWECDYPHSDTPWPRGPESLHRQLEAVRLPDEQVDKITWQNACRFFRFDPLAAAGITRAEATVGALRARAADVDVAVTTRAEYRQRYELAHAG